MPTSPIPEALSRFDQYRLTVQTNADIGAILRTRAATCLARAAENAAKFNNPKFPDMDYGKHDREHADRLLESARAVETSAFDVAAIYNADKKALKTVSPEALEFAVEVARNFWTVGEGSPVARTNNMHGEVTRRKREATKARRAVEEATREASGATFVPGEVVQVHAMGYWYTGKVLRVKRTGSVEVEYTSGAGTTRQKTVGSEKIRKVA